MRKLTKFSVNKHEIRLCEVSKDIDKNTNTIAITRDGLSYNNIMRKKLTSLKAPSKVRYCKNINYNLILKTYLKEDCVITSYCINAYKAIFRYVNSYGVEKEIKINIEDIASTYDALGSKTDILLPEDIFKYNILKTKVISFRQSIDYYFYCNDKARGPLEIVPTNKALNRLYKLSLPYGSNYRESLQFENKDNMLKDLVLSPGQFLVICTDKIN